MTKIMIFSSSLQLGVASEGDKPWKVLSEVPPRPAGGDKERGEDLRRVRRR
jgi:hypothetical protein